MPQDSCGIVEVAESILDSALCSAEADNSTALTVRAGLRLSTGSVSKTSCSHSATGALHLHIAFARLLRQYRACCDLCHRCGLYVLEQNKTLAGDVDQKTQNIKKKYSTTYD